MIPVPHLEDPQEILRNRGILEQALLAGWIELESYWRYKVINPQGETIAEREKRYPFADKEKHKAKVRWHPSKPTNPDSDWYILPDTIQAIQGAGGVCYLSNGEPAMLAYRAAGILNVIATTLSEVAVPKNILSYLRGIGVSRLLYPIDKDKAGERSAQNWHDALIASGIDFEALSWPDTMPEKADGNDVYIALNFDSSAFQDVLKSLKPLTLETTVKTPVSPFIATEFDKSSLVAALHTALNHAGKLGRKIRQGVWQECHCVFSQLLICSLSTISAFCLCSAS